MTPSNFQKRTLWSALTGLAIVFIGALVVGLIWLGGQVLGYLQPVLVPLAVAGIIAYLLEPVVQHLQNHNNVSRLPAVLLVLGASAIIVIAFSTFVGVEIANQASKLTKEKNLGTQLVDELQEIQDTIKARPFVDYLTEFKKPKNLVTADTPDDELFFEKPYPAQEKRDDNGQTITVWVDNNGNEITPVGNENTLNPDTQTPYINPKQAEAFNNYTQQTKNLDFLDQRLGIWINKNRDNITERLLNWLKASTRVFGFIGYLLGFLLVPVYLFYFLNESAKIKTSWTQYIPLKASKFKDEVIATVTEINSYLISFFRGQVLVSLIDGLLVGIALSIFQLPYGFLIGLALAVLGIIPFIGNILCMIPSILIALAHFGGENPNHQWLGSNPWFYVLAVLAIFIIVQNINSLVTAPKIVGDSVGLHPMTVIFSIIFWSLLLGGFLGALLAVPLTAAIKVLFQRYLWETRITPNLPNKQEPLTNTPT